jgi:hypothetical protein
LVGFTSKTPHGRMASEAAWLKGKDSFWR